MLKVNENEYFLFIKWVNLVGNETGNKYGEYTVIQFIRTDKVHTWYRVKCSCGKEEIKRIDRIKSDINAR